MGDPKLWNGYQQIEDTLVRCGVPRPAEPWRREIERFYLHPTATRWVACVGRGGGKNLVGLMCDLTELVYGDFAIPAGERHYHVHTSETKQEAEKTLAQAVQYTRFLGLKATSTVDTIHFGGSLSDRGLKVLANRIGANSGWRSTGGTTQELAKWNDEGTNPAEEIVTSWLAQMITHARAQGRTRARSRHFFTPLTRSGFAYDLLSQGETAAQIVTRGPTWKFNPSVTEQACRDMATSDRVFRREYEAEPQAGALSAFDADAIDRAFAHRRPSGTDVQGHRIVVTDASSGKKDAYTYGVANWVGPAGGNVPKFEPYLCFHAVDGIGGSFWSHTSGDEVVKRIAKFAEHWGTRSIHADQREEMMLSSAFHQRGLAYHVHPWTATSKPAAVERVRRWLASGTLALPKHDRLRNELLSFEEKITPSGQFTFGGRGSGHDDYVALLITAAHAEIAGDLTPPGRGIWRPPPLVHGDPSHSRYADIDNDTSGSRYGSGRGFF